MLHSIPTAKFGPLGQPMAKAVESCVHCGFCLAACPTYTQLGQEMDTPRGRIVLMKQVLEGGLPWSAAQPHIDQCLGCLACEPACPSGVPYRDLISPFRALAEPSFARTKGQRLRRSLARTFLPFPSRLRWAVRLGQFGQRMGGLLPQALRPMLELLPDRLPQALPIPSITPAEGERRARVALLLGCAQQVFAPDITAATVRALAIQGVETIVPRGQGCCGALAWHTGDWAAARQFAFRNIQAFPTDVDAIITNAAGCGSALHEYPLILRGTANEAAAVALSKRTLDVSVFLIRLGLRPVASAGQPVRIAYQDACHLKNAQGVESEPRQLLRSIPGASLCELPEGHLCCGSAGTYNLDQPALASALGRRKAEALIASGAEMAATGNIGCLVQLQSHLRKLHSAIRVRHVMQILRDVWDGPRQGD